MQETVTNTSERKSLFSSFLEVLEAREKQAQVDRQIQEEKYLRRTQRIYDFHERQRREAVELRRCLDYVSQHAHVLETVLRGAGGRAAALHGAVRRQCIAHTTSARRHASPADGHHARQDGGGAEYVDVVPAARRRRHLQHGGGHRQPAQHDRGATSLCPRGVGEQRVRVHVRRGPPRRHRHRHRAATTRRHRRRHRHRHRHRRGHGHGHGRGRRGRGRGRGCGRRHVRVPAGAARAVGRVQHAARARLATRHARTLRRTHRRRTAMLHHATLVYHCTLYTVHCADS